MHDAAGTETAPTEATGERILVVDDDAAMREMLADALEDAGFSVRAEACARDGLLACEQESFAAILTDVRMAGMSGIEFCDRARAHWPDLPVVVMTAFGSMELAVDALRAGAFDFITKPLDLETLRLSLLRASETSRLRCAAAGDPEDAPRLDGTAPMLGSSAGMRATRDLLARVARSATSLLLTGESGTGKEVAARFVHERSDRRDGPFVAINCAAMPEGVLESELFGHVRGAFTDASHARQGLLLQASGGTLLLDEIGEMPLSLQPRLLRALEERRIRPVGSDHEIPFDARIIAATNQDLERAVEEGRFRRDLFYRLDVIAAHLPPLRERGDDILELARHFANTHGPDETSAFRLTPEAARLLRGYAWPGNIRELRNAMERAVTLAAGREIRPADLPPSICGDVLPEAAVGGEARQPVYSASTPRGLPTLAEMERLYIEQVLDSTDRNKSHAARILGVDRKTLHRKQARWQDTDAAETA